MRKKLRKNILFVGKSEKPSRFRITLKQIHKKISDDDDEREIINLVQARHKNEGKIRRASVWNRFIIKNLAKRADSKLEGLFFHDLLKFSIKLLVKFTYFLLHIAYFPGWLAYFVLRFIYYFFKKIFSLFLRIIFANAQNPKKYDISKNFLGKRIFFSEKSEVAMADFANIFSIPDPPKQKSGFLRKFRENIFAKKRNIEIPAPCIKQAVIWKKPIVFLRTMFKRRSEKEKSQEKTLRYFIPALKFSIMPAPHSIFLSLKKSLVFALIAGLLIAPFKAVDIYNNFSLDDLKNNVLGRSEIAFSNMLGAAEAASSLDMKKAEQDFSQASFNFSQAKEELGDLNSFLIGFARFVPDARLKAASYSPLILSAGESAAGLGEDLTAGLDWFLEKTDNMERIAGLRDRFSTAEIKAAQIQSLLEQINPQDVPEEFKQQFVSLSGSPLRLRKALHEIVGLLDFLATVIGKKENKRYLVVFQNNSEMRASGGFIGSFVLVDFANGKIKNMQVPGGGSYDTEAGLLKLVKAPQPLSLVNPLWHFWDANWWPDWSQSARKLAWFYEKSGGSTVDGVISITPSVVENLLKIIGPVELPEYEKTINADNFFDFVQELSERKLDETKFPKKIISDLLEEILRIIPSRLDKNILLGMTALFQGSMEEKQILFYSEDQALQKFAEEHNWAGRLQETNGDYFLLVDTNIAGGKSDRAIQESISHQAHIADDGSIIDTVEIRRTHTGAYNQAFVGVGNNDWMRFYVPLGSELLEAHGFSKIDQSLFGIPDKSWENDPDIAAEENAILDARTGMKVYAESGKTVFADWSQVKPGDTVLLTLKYRLPIKVSFAEKIENISWSGNWQEKIAEIFNPWQKPLAVYSLLWQKQPGSRDAVISSNLIFDYKFSSLWQYPHDCIFLQNSGWQIEDTLHKDLFFAVVVEK